MLTARPTPAGRMGRDDHGVDSPFGYSAGYRGGKYFHHGEDYYFLNADVAGSRKVFAAGEGTVADVYWNPEMGGCILINHGDFETRSCHMPKGSATVRVGDRVTDRTFFGPMGNEGTAAGGEFHLHFEVFVNGVRVDPEPYFTATAGGGTKIIELEGDVTVRIIQDVDTSKYYRLGEFSALELAPSVAAQEVTAWHTDGKGIALPHATVLQLIADANAVAALIPVGPSAPAGGVSKADVDAAATRVIAAVPTAVQNGQASRSAIIK